MKKKLMTVLALVLVIALSVAGTYAYLTSQDTVTNTFTVGNVKITLTEPNWVESGSVDAPDVYAGEPLEKDPTVTNTGANPCFVRVSVTNLDQFGNKGAIQYRNANYQVGQLNEGWVYHDGYFYYTKVLAADAVTTPVFSSIVMPTGLTGGENAEDIVVTAYAVQAQGAKASWSAVQNMTVEEIAAWFNTCMPTTP